jgi:hypothetical protein
VDNIGEGVDNKEYATPRCKQRKYNCNLAASAAAETNVPPHPLHTACPAVLTMTDALRHVSGYPVKLNGNQHTSSSTVRDTW